MLRSAQRLLPLAAAGTVTYVCPHNTAIQSQTANTEYRLQTKPLAAPKKILALSLAQQAMDSDIVHREPSKSSDGYYSFVVIGKDVAAQAAVEGDGCQIVSFTLH